MPRYGTRKRIVLIAVLLGALSIAAMSIAIAASKSAFNLNSPASFPVDI